MDRVQEPREWSLGVVDGGRDDEKLELVARQGDRGAVEVELRLLAWGEGVGWYPQRTLPLTGNLAQLRALLRRADAVRRSGAASPASANVLPFPRAAADLARPASA